MKKLLSLTLALVMIVTCLAGLASAATIATIETNGKTVEAATVEDIIAAIDASGKSVVTLKADVTYDKQASFPYSCTIDMAGHTWTAEKSNAFAIAAVGTENEIATLKNGIVLHKVVGFFLHLLVDGFGGGKRMVAVADCHIKLVAFAALLYASGNRCINLRCLFLRHDHTANRSAPLHQRKMIRFRIVFL